jgi:ABC-type glycerol-3-phosphate transport system substrate-binding protein
MKPNIKWITLLVTAILMISLVGCKQEAATTEPPAAQQPAETQEPAEAATEEPVEVATEEPAPVETEAPPEPVTIRYANWNLGTEEENNIQRQLIQAYIDANPHVTIELVDMSGEGGWDAILTSYAARGELPDVFMANNVPLYVQNGWLADLTEFTANDPAWEYVPEVLRESFTYSGRVLGLPAAQFIMGYFVNQDLYEAANLDAPAYGFTLDEFRDAVVSLNDIDNGVLGLDEMEFILGWYPNVVDPNLMWFSFDGTHMNYNSAAFKDAIQFQGEMRQYTWQGLTEEQRTNFISTGPWELFLNQEVGMRWDASWSVPNYVQNATFNWDFIGFPGGNQAIVFDVIVVSATAANPQEAYNFARWMTFSPEAYAVEAELARAMGSAPKMPVAVTDEAIALYTEFVNTPGILTALSNLDNSVIESLAKIVPGYINARWEGKPGIDIGSDLDVNMWYMFNFANEGRFQYTDYSARLEEFANQILDDAAAALNP